MNFTPLPTYTISPRRDDGTKLWWNLAVPTRIILTISSLPLAFPNSWPGESRSCDAIAKPCFIATVVGCRRRVPVFGTCFHRKHGKRSISLRPAVMAKMPWSKDNSAHPAKIRCPTLGVLPAQDRIVPPASAKALTDAIPGADVFSPKAGHIGMMMGGKARTGLWAPLADWLKKL